MENTSSLLFDNKNAKYYFNDNGNIAGPLTAQEIYEKVVNGVLSQMDFIYEDSFSDFKRISEIDEFEVMIPRKPEVSELQAIRKVIQGKKKSSVKDMVETPPLFFVFFHKTQYGPFTNQELVHLFEAHKLDSSAYLWQTGWPNWKPAKDVSEFQKYIVEKPAKASTSKSSKSKDDKTKSKIILNRRERRITPRKPLIARLFVTNNEDVVIAVCRDISIGGMQVLTDRIPGEIGTKVKLNVTPADSKKVTGFTAEGEIVRKLEDGRGFSFRFTKLSADAKKTIESYTHE